VIAGLTAAGVIQRPFVTELVRSGSAECRARMPELATASLWIDSLTAMHFDANPEVTVPLPKCEALTLI